MKLIDANVKVSLFRNTLPNYSLTYILGKIKGVPLNLPIYPLGKLIRNVGNIILSSLRPYRRRQIIKLGLKEYNITMSSIGYLLKKGKDKPSDQVIINIDRVIIRK